MSNMISVASGFQYSVNIGYDLNNDDKLKNFIPTQSALTLLEDILLSTRITSTERARVLIGAYGKGKSHSFCLNWRATSDCISVCRIIMKVTKNFFR